MDDDDDSPPKANDDLVDLKTELESIDDETGKSHVWMTVVFIGVAIFVLLSFVFIYLYTVAQIKIRKQKKELNTCNNDTTTTQSDIDKFTTQNDACQVELSESDKDSLGIFTFDTSKFDQMPRVFFKIDPDNINSSRTGVYPITTNRLDAGSLLLSNGQQPTKDDVRPKEKDSGYKYGFADKFVPSTEFKRQYPFWQLINRLQFGWSFKWEYYTASYQDGNSVKYSFLIGSGSGTENVYNSGINMQGGFPTCIAPGSLNTITLTYQNLTYTYDFNTPSRNFVMILSHPDTDTTKAVVTMGFLG